MMIEKHRYLGHMRFVGELFLKELLKDEHVHGAIDTLLGEEENPDEVGQAGRQAQAHDAGDDVGISMRHVPPCCGRECGVPSRGMPPATPAHARCLAVRRCAWCGCCCCRRCWSACASC